MGAKDSRPSFISYEDAVKRISDSELRRIRDAFKRCAGANGSSLSLDAFVHEVLCDGVPHEVAEWLYQASGGTKRGIAFKDLLCGIVVLTKGTVDEKIKFLWTLYVNNQNDNGTYINKWDFARALHLENTSLPVANAPKTADILNGLFGLCDKVPYDQFRSWLLIHKDATVLSKWLLVDFPNIGQDLETPTFYQSLAGVTHLEERDIIELEKCFWSLHNAAQSGQIDLDSLSPLLSPPLPKPAVAGVFHAFDENRDGHIDFKELCCGLSAACRGPRTERLKFCFKIFDLDRDGFLNKKELIDMVGILCTIANEAKSHSSRASTPSDSDSDSTVTDKGFDPEVVLVNLRDKLVTNLPKNGRKPMFQLGPSVEGEDIVAKEEAALEDEGLISNGLALTQEDFLIWSVESADALVSPFLELLYEACHIVLGLRPQCRHKERDIVLGWLRREVGRGYSVGQFWYLVGMEWWSGWLAYTAAGADHCCRAAPAPRLVDEAVVCDESFTTNSSESMGSLLWRAETLEAAETASLGSAGSSSGVSSAAPRPRRPGPVDNSRLLQPVTHKVRALTGEGGHVRRDVTLAQHRDFELLPDALWRALALWYGAPHPLPRQVIRPPNSDVELELYPLQLKLLRHVPGTQRASTSAVVGLGGVAVYGGAALGGSSASAAPPDKQLAYTAAFSRLATVKQVSEFICGALGLARENVRLWVIPGAGGAQLLLDDERPTLSELRLDERARLLVEVRNPDLTWPEEIGALSAGGSRATERRETLTAPNLPGATGLHNLGNTCFMNAALQCVWNTGPLTQYFNSGMHMYEVNTTNPLGTKGALALRYGELCKEVWSCTAVSVAPLRVRWCVSRWARALGGGGQHDAQELLAWLLDALHEDLNRAALPAPPPPPPHRDSDGRPDQVVASEAWAAYALRNNSIMTELFYGQLKSKVSCDTCGHESVRFDTFNMLSLPLPMESFVCFELKVILLDGSVPVKYAVRVNSEGTYLDLKQKLSTLCGLSPEAMLVVEVQGSMFGRVFEDGAKLASPLGSASGVAPAPVDLHVYEVPTREADAHDNTDVAPHGSEWSCGGTDSRCGAGCDAGVGTGGDEVGGAWGEVSDAPSALCMPALFCFKKSRCELLAHSPHSTFLSPKSNIPYTDIPTGDYRSNSPPGTALHRHSPTLSVKSLNVAPSSPKLAKVKFASSPSNMYRMNEIKECHSPPPGKIQYLVAIHRKQVRSEAYFLPVSGSGWRVFGCPLVVGLRAGLSGRELYARVCAQLQRLMTRRPPPDQHNHATDCDDSLGYGFPFTLRLVTRRGLRCARCAWPQLCRGCALPSTHQPLVYKHPADTTHYSRVSESSSIDVGSEERTDSPLARVRFNTLHSTRSSLDSQGSCDKDSGVVSRLNLSELHAGVVLAVDWDPTALHLHYQSNREKACEEHRSVREQSAVARAVDLHSCLRAFTSAERLEERYHCAACRSAQPATKKLQIWRLPPILIVHLKRFQYVNNKWIKSHKVVNFPFQDFDPTEFLASVPQETILRHNELKQQMKRRSSMFVDIDDHISESDSDEENSPSQAPKENGKLKLKIDKREGETRGRERLESTSLVTTPVLDDNLVDYHKHHLKNEQDPFDLKYRLYAVVSHSGQLSGGHYVSYCRNPSGAWLCYNDSSCRVLPPPASAAVDPAAAYLLFYERQQLHYERYVPHPPPGAPPPLDDLVPDESDLKKMCSIA